MLLPQHLDLVAHATVWHRAPDNAPASIGSTTRLASTPSVMSTCEALLVAGAPRPYRLRIKQTHVSVKGSLRQVFTNQLDRPRLFQPFRLDIVDQLVYGRETTT